MKIIVIFFILFICLFLEATFINLPFVLLGIIFFAFFLRREWAFLTAFLMGLFLDILTFKSVGITSLYFSIVLGALFLYRRKYEIQSLPFFLTFSFLSSVVYKILFN